MTLIQYNRAKENEVYRHELEIEMQRRRRYLEMCKMMEEYNQRYFHFHNPSQDSHREGADYTRVEVRRENSDVVGHIKDQLHIPRDINEWLHQRTHNLGEYTK